MAPTPTSPQARRLLCGGGVGRGARVARTERAPRRPVVTPLQVSHHYLVKAQIPTSAVQLENLAELIDRRIVDGDLVGNTPQECLVSE